MPELIESVDEIPLPLRIKLAKLGVDLGDQSLEFLILKGEKKLKMK